MTQTPIRELIKKYDQEKPGFKAGVELEEQKLEAALAVMELRQSKGLTQQELARLSGKPQSTIARIENGNMNVSFKVMNEIATAVGKKVKIEFVEA
ncbi:MAG: helix-turn-helix transcriptional regulator [Streptococcaceae bacterium]|jgi:DNA-binding XRE family transcriptional regulator|nr:helix-turn-helix transcriptional regulator [Streptococcaceae bacterium]